MKPFLMTFISLSFVLLLSCQREDDTKKTGNLEDFLSCDLLDYELTGFAHCSERNGDSSLYCDFVYEGTQMLLTSSRSDLRYMCGDIKQVVFEDSLGTTLFYRKEEGAYISSLGFGIQGCDSLSGLEVYDCREEETLYATLKNDVQDMYFIIHLDPFHRNDADPNDNFDGLTIWRAGIQPNPLWRKTVMSYKLYDGPKRTAAGSYSHFAESLELNGQVYDSVFYANPNLNAAADMEIYYTRKFGIVAYRDMEGRAWYLKEFR